MHLRSLFSWFFNKISFILIVLAILVAWRQSSISYKHKLNLIETELFRYCSTVMAKAEFSSSTHDSFKATLITAEGVVVNDGEFGSGTSLLGVVDFERALKGEPFLTTRREQGVQYLVYWTPFQLNEKQHVLMVKTQHEASLLEFFITNLIINVVIGLILASILTKKLASPVEQFIDQITADLKNIRKEYYHIGSNELETIETADLYTSLEKLTAKVKKEYFKLRKDVGQWKVFFSTLPRGVLAIDSERTIINCNQRSLDMISLQSKNVEESIDASVMVSFRNADLNNITRNFLDSGEYIKEYEFEQVVENIVETFKVVCVELKLKKSIEEPGALVIIENITALRRLENMRKDFVANVSHELKTPIAIIGGFVETLKDCTDDPDSTLRFIDIIEKNTARLTMVIDDLLSLSKLEQNEMLIKKDFEKRPIEETVKAAIDVCSYEAKKKSIELDVDLEDSKYYKKDGMYANHRLLEQSIRNIIENAVRYSPENTRVSITSKKVQENIEIRVKDHGPGLAAEHHQKIFERFYRVDKSRDRQTGGSGLGLAIVKHILRVHSGNITLNSEEGKGCEFIITIPYVTKPQIAS
ncbi:MAG: ATP-binding protein [Lentisphaeraceae bacterium]|nr:ATP-binding protein [Lentisphaeraceae bacterium]